MANLNRVDNEYRLVQDPTDGDLLVEVNRTCWTFLVSARPSPMPEIVKWAADNPSEPVPSAATTGTLNIYVKVRPDAEWEPLMDPATDAQHFIDLENPLSFLVRTWASDFRFEPVTVDGAYSIYIDESS